MEKKEKAIVETDFEEREITSVDGEGRLGKEWLRVKEYKVPVKELEGTISVFLKRKDRYTGVRIDDKDVMIYVGENRNGNRWLTEINNVVKSHPDRESAEDYTGKKIVEIVKYLGEKANHIYRMAKTKTYENGRVIRHEYGDLVITKVEKIDDIWDVHVLGKSVWVYENYGEGLREAKKYFIRYYVQREFIESPWGNYMGDYREIIEKYTQKLIDKEKFVDEKRGLWVLTGGSGERRAFVDEFFKRADSRYMVMTVEACMCIGKYYLSEMFEKDYPELKAVSILSGIKNAFDDEEDRKSMKIFIDNFSEIRNMILKSGVN